MMATSAITPAHLQRTIIMAAKPGDGVKALTRDAKAMIQLAFQDLGGLPRLVEWANQPQNISQFYTQLWAKIIPKDIKSEVTGENGGPVKYEMSWAGAPPETLSSTDPEDTELLELATSGVILEAHDEEGE
jgi:hypothetical protein